MADPAGKFTILIVDDSEDILDLLELTLGKNYRVKRATDGRSALRVAFEKPRPDLILLDVEMPGSSGYDVCRAIKASPALADVPVIFLTHRNEARDVVQGFQLGAIDYFAKPINPPVLAARIHAHVELITRRGQQEELIRVRTAQLEQTRLQLIRRLGRAMEYHETSAVGNRVVRLGHYARHLAEAMGAKPALCDLIMKAAPLHDIGKIGVPAQILRKSEKLTAPEREQMQRHPEIGAEIIGEHDDPLLKLARILALTHHERWDGTGYPAGIGGNEIPWAGRVMAVVDAFEGMTATQFHREPMPLELAVGEIMRGSGKQFDPQMVEAFRKALPAFRKVRETYSDALGDMLDLDFLSAPPPQAAQDTAVAPAIAAAEQEAAEARAVQGMREADEARAGVLASAQARLKVERELTAAAAKDISTQQAARKRAEDAGAREAEALGLNRRRIAEEAAAARAAQERAKAEAAAADLARQAESAKAQALAEAEMRVAAERALTDAAEDRKKADEALAKTAANLAARETEALELARKRIAQEADATRMAQARAKAEEDAAKVAQQAAQVQEQLLAEADARARADERAIAAMLVQRQAERDLTAAAARKTAAERSALKLAEERAAREAEALEAANQRLAEESAATRLAQQRAQAEEDAVKMAQQAAQAGEQMLAEAAARAKAEQALAVAADEKRKAEEAAARAAEAVAAAGQQMAAAARQRAGDEAAARAAAENRLKAEADGALAVKQAEGSNAQALADGKAIADIQARIAIDRDLAAAAENKIAAERAALARAQERVKAEDQALKEAQQALHDREQALAEAEARVAAEHAIAAAQAKMRLEEESERRELEHVPAEEAPPPARRGKFLPVLYAIVLMMAVTAAAVFYLELQTRPAQIAIQKSVPPPVAIKVNEPKPIAGLSEGEPLNLRLEVNVEKLAPRERAN